MRNVADLCAAPGGWSQARDEQLSVFVGDGQGSITDPQT